MRARSVVPLPAQHLSGQRPANFRDVDKDKRQQLDRHPTASAAFLAIDLGSFALQAAALEYDPA